MIVLCCIVLSTRQYSSLAGLRSDVARARGMAAPRHVSSSQLSTSTTDDADSTGRTTTRPRSHHSGQHHRPLELPRVLWSVGGELVFPVFGR